MSDAPKSIEISAASPRAAIKKALKMLGVDKDKVIIKVLSEEKKGLFGMRGSAQAKVRVTLKEELNPE